MPQETGFADSERHPIQLLECVGAGTSAEPRSAQVLPADPSRRKVINGIHGEIL